MRQGALAFDLDLDVDVDVDLDGDDDLDLDLLSLTTPSARNCHDDTADGKPMLSFQRLEVYQRAIEFLALTIDIVGCVPKGHSERSDQLVRAAESVVRNIAEGAGRWSEADRAKHYKIARGEAMECAASLDVMKLRRLVAPEAYEQGIRLLESVVGMLTKMI